MHPKNKKEMLNYYYHHDSVSFIEIKRIEEIVSNYDIFDYQLDLFFIFLRKVDQMYQKILNIGLEELEKAIANCIDKTLYLSYVQKKNEMKEIVGYYIAPKYLANLDLFCSELTKDLICELDVDKNPLAEKIETQVKNMGQIFSQRLKKEVMVVEWGIEAIHLCSLRNVSMYDHERIKHLLDQHRLPNFDPKTDPIIIKYSQSKMVLERYRISSEICDPPIRSPHCNFSYYNYNNPYENMYKTRIAEANKVLEPLNLEAVAPALDKMHSDLIDCLEQHGFAKRGELINLLCHVLYTHRYTLCYLCRTEKETIDDFFQSITNSNQINSRYEDMLDYFSIRKSIPKNFPSNTIFQIFSRALNIEITIYSAESKIVIQNATLPNPIKIDIYQYNSDCFFNIIPAKTEFQKLGKPLFHGPVNNINDLVRV